MIKASGYPAAEQARNVIICRYSTPQPSPDSKLWKSIAAINRITCVSEHFVRMILSEVEALLQ